MTVTGSAPETDSLEIAQVVQTIKTMDLAEDDTEDVDFVASEEELEVKLYFDSHNRYFRKLKIQKQTLPTKKRRTKARRSRSKKSLSRKTSVSRSSMEKSKSSSSLKTRWSKTLRLLFIYFA